MSKLIKINRLKKFSDGLSSKFKYIDILNILFVNFYNYKNTLWFEKKFPIILRNFGGSFSMPQNVPNITYTISYFCKCVNTFEKESSGGAVEILLNGPFSTFNLNGIAQNT